MSDIKAELCWVRAKQCRTPTEDGRLVLRLVCDGGVNLMDVDWREVVGGEDGRLVLMLVCRKKAVNLMSLQN